MLPAVRKVQLQLRMPRLKAVLKHLQKLVKKTWLKAKRLQIIKKVKSLKARHLMEKSLRVKPPMEHLAVVPEEKAVAALAAVAAALI